MRLLQVCDNFHQLRCLYINTGTYRFFLVFNCLVVFLVGAHFSQNVGFIYKSESVLYFAHLLGTSMHDHFFNHLQSLFEVFLSTKTLSFEYESLYVLDDIFVFPS